MSVRKGATLEEWATFDLALGLTQDLLPVVSDQSVKISLRSTMTAVGKTPSAVNRQGFAAGFANWTSYETTDKDIKKWSTDPRLGICLQTRTVRALDIDVPDADEAEAIMAMLRHLKAPVRFRKDSAKFLMLIELPGEYAKRSFKTQHGLVEFLATGQQCIVAGTHTDGERYQWSKLTTIPTITPTQFEELWAKLVETFAVDKEERATASTKKETLNAALQSDPVAQHLIDNHWVYSIEKDGRLNIRCPNEAAHTSASSETATVYYPANTGGYARGHFDCKHAHCQSLTDEEFQRGVGYDDLAFDDLTDDDELERLTDERPSPSRFALVHISEFRARKSQGYHIKGVIPKGDMVMVYGPPSSGKSFMAFDMAMAIARGIPWRGHRVKQGTVAYIVAEGAEGFNKRIRAYEEYHGVNTADFPFYLMADNPNLLQAKDAKDVVASLEVAKPDIVIIDTWAQVTAGGNENSGEDMGKALAHCRGINKKTGATVYIVHHSGKDAAKGARGWSGLKGAADAELEIARSGDDRVLSVTKSKDGVDNLDFGFKLNVVTLGQDEDGDDITSCVVLEHDVTKAAVSNSKVQLGKLEAIVVKAVVNGGELDEEAPDVNTMLDYAVSQVPFDGAEGKRDKRKENLLRAYRKLIERKILREDDGRVYLADNS